ncbi:uncharacterized protein LOC119724577 [Patiria miniata]|uniref:SWIM-type domain-containing protein n=1 Tax=Patiria miniata TaxID=46514 RepID=A0A913ZIJ2_PATMI|nr:uncharacterized protein LOC119724577 [Patiria miniata]
MAEFITVDSRLVEPLAPKPGLEGEPSTIEEFLEFSTAELKFFLLNKGESIAGCRAELAERAVLAQQRANNTGPTEPKKFKIEREEAKGEYASVLEEYSLTDPDVANEWSVDISGLPNLDTGKIFHYILTKEAFDTYYLSEYKSKKAYQYLESVCVRSIQVHVASDFIFVKGTIAPLNESGDGFEPLKRANVVKILTTVDKDIIVSCCSCTSELYQCCNHVITVLFRIERLVREMNARETTGKTPDPTPEHQDGFKPVKISDLYKKKDPFSQSLLEKIHKPSAEEKRRFMEKICQTIPNCLFAQMFKGSIGVTVTPDQGTQPTKAVTEPNAALATTTQVQTAAQSATTSQTIPVALATASIANSTPVPISLVAVTAQVTQPAQSTPSAQTTSVPKSENQTP